jgi:hypothetical protein
MITYSAKLHASRSPSTVARSEQQKISLSHLGPLVRIKLPGEDRLSSIIVFDPVNLFGLKKQCLTSAIVENIFLKLSNSFRGPVDRQLVEQFVAQINQRSGFILEVAEKLSAQNVEEFIQNEGIAQLASMLMEEAKKVGMPISELCEPPKFLLRYIPRTLV